MLNIDNISKAVNSSSSSLQDLFRKTCNISIHEYIVNRRMTLASHNLIESNEEIIHIAEKYGYEQNSFTRAFKKNYNITPSEYRKKGILQKDFDRIDIKSINLNKIFFVEKNCNNCVFNMGVCAGRTKEYGMPIEKVMQLFPNGCEEFEYTLEAYNENEKKKEKFVKELKNYAK